MSDELVLIIEDNEKNLKLTRDLLQVKGYRTIEATEAGAGIALALEHLPSVVLMDIQLPDMDGREALAVLRADDRTAAIPVIAVTAFAMTGDRERFLEAGFDDYVTKPIDVRAFPELVGSFCGQAR
ncbi:MAG: two-component system, cell cycle response regulator DivK [Actinomycetota bacterium]|jgi:two-component system cell cycle response regulator DivK